MRKITIKLLKTLPTKYVTTGVILIIALFIYGIVGSYFIMGLNLIDSIYYAVITMATVGYGDYIPTTGIQKIFATTLALGGVALLAYVFNIIITNFQEKMGEYSKGAMKMKAIENMDDYYILCGYGRVGKVVFEELTKRNQNVILFEKNEEIIEEIEESDSVVAIHKDATEDDLISKLAGDKCRSVIISTGDDVTNLFIVLTIRESNPDAWIVSRASKEENYSRLRKAGADKIVSPELIGGKDLYFESTRPHILKLTVRHGVDKLYDEFKIISDHGCNLENIQYHFPGIETPLTRKINTMDLKDGKQFKKYLENNAEQKEAIENLYKIVNNTHSHIISGPDRATFHKLIKELEKNEEILGINLTKKEVAELTRKNIE
ncbi:MAG: NAD-binding protein [Methanobrevibacter sp.]|uniref:NAD-binding protein n=1 Tax=Methanobrevibacter sp. TaxID=66852 RepID=UPI0025E0F1A5|nr:NAD-binding protein [Methanobrevibacter sp.]MBQ6099784.1 NAD-binding protein [Methanobrevibacter sp.]